MVDFSSHNIKIRLYEEKTDYEGVEALLRRHGFLDISRDHFKGLALVAVNGNEIVGFVWALVGESDIAYGDYLATDRLEGDTMKPNLVSCLLVPTFFQHLLDLGIKNYKLFTMNQDRFVSDEYLNRTYTRYGADCLGRQLVYSGYVPKIVRTIRENLPKDRPDGQDIIKSTLR